MQCQNPECLELRHSVNGLKQQSTLLTTVCDLLDAAEAQNEAYRARFKQLGVPLPPPLKKRPKKEK